MVRTCLCLKKCYSFPLAEFTKNLTYGALFLSVKYLSSVFRSKYYMVFAVPFRMR